MLPLQGAQRKATRIVEWSALETANMKYLGSGEFATAHRTTLDGQSVALKMLKKEKKDKPDALAGLKREIMLMTLMEHPNVLPGIALGQVDGQPLMVMALLASVLSAELPRSNDTVPVWVRWRDQRKWPLSRALRYGVELGCALRYCHHEAFPGMRVLHRDIKPNNIGLLGDGRLVLFDFGLSSLWSASEEGQFDDAPKPLTGETGSLRYMAPEVALARPYNYKAEVFSFASVLWELGSHLKPFEALSPPVFLKAIGNGHRPTVPKKWPQELHELFAECWAADAADRPDFRTIVPRLEVMRADVLKKEPKAKQSARYVGDDLETSEATATVLTTSNGSIEA